MINKIKDHWYILVMLVLILFILPIVADSEIHNCRILMQMAVLIWLAKDSASYSASCQSDRRLESNIKDLKIKQKEYQDLLNITQKEYQDMRIYINETIRESHQKFKW